MSSYQTNSSCRFSDHTDSPWCAAYQTALSSVSAFHRPPADHCAMPRPGPPPSCAIVGLRSDSCWRLPTMAAAWKLRSPLPTKNSYAAFSFAETVTGDSDEPTSTSPCSALAEHPAITIATAARRNGARRRKAVALMEPRYCDGRTVPALRRTRARSGRVAIPSRGDASESRGVAENGVDRARARSRGGGAFSRVSIECPGNAPMCAYVTEASRARIVSATAYRCRARAPLRAASTDDEGARARGTPRRPGRSRRSARPARGA